jgi:Na+/melibiose symporter-like transporter
LKRDSVEKEQEDVIDARKSTLKRDGLTPLHVNAYSVGHFNNDLCAAMWFVYLAWYLNKVVGLDADVTG